MGVNDGLLSARAHTCICFVQRLFYIRITIFDSLHEWWENDKKAALHSWALLLKVDPFFKGGLVFRWPPSPGFSSSPATIHLAKALLIIITYPATMKITSTHAIDD